MGKTLTWWILGALALGLAEPRAGASLSGRVTANFINICETAQCGNNLSVDDAIGHGTVVASLAAGRPATGIYSGGETGTCPESLTT